MKTMMIRIILSVTSVIMVLLIALVIAVYHIIDLLFKIKLKAVALWLKSRRFPVNDPPLWHH